MHWRKAAGIAMVISSAILVDNSSCLPASASVPPPTNQATASASVAPTPVSPADVGAQLAPTPPPGADLTRLTPADAQRYGIPPAPPSGSPEYTQWYNSIKTVKSIVSPSFGKRPISSHPPTRTISSSGRSAAALSSDWAGYVADGLQGSNISTVQAYFTIPDIYGSTGTRVSTLWAGLGSALTASDPLIQAGVEIDTYGSTYTLTPWWEAYPNITYEVTVGAFAVHAHDSVWVVISNDSTSNRSTFWMEDATTGQASSWFASYSCLCSQIEAVLEHTETTNGYNMTILGPSSFSNVGGKDGAAFYWLGSYQAAVTEAFGSDGKVLAYPGSLVSGSDHFTVTRTPND